MTELTIQLDSRDEAMLLFGSRFLSGGLLHHLIRVATALPRHGALSGSSSGGSSQRRKET